MKNVLLFLFLFLYFHVRSQSYSNYYEQINKAELKIIDYDFRGALDIYNQVFSSYNKHHSRDLYNASLCAILTSNNKKALEWIKEQIIQGATLESFKSKIYRQLSDADWNFLKLEYDSLRAIYNSMIDEDFKSILDSLRDKEQSFVYGNSYRYDSLVFEHAKVLHSLISARGIPKVAIFSGQKLPIDVIRHHFGVKNLIKYNVDGSRNSKLYAALDFSKYDLEPLLIAAVFKGEIEPQFVAACLEYNEMDKVKKSIVFHISIDLNTNTVNSILPEKLDTLSVNSYRKYIGLEPLSDAMKKCIMASFYYNQNKFPFNEHHRKFKEIGFSKTALDTLKGDENNALLFKAQDIIQEIKRKHLESNILFEFKLNQTGFTHSIEFPIN